LDHGVADTLVSVGAITGEGFGKLTGCQSPNACARAPIFDRGHQMPPRPKRPQIIAFWLANGVLAASAADLALVPMAAVR
jgi:hypothetical protein